VFKKERHTRFHARLDSSPREAAVALVYEVWRLSFNLAPSAAREDKIVAQVEGRARRARRLRLNYLHRCATLIKASNPVIANQTHACAELRRGFYKTVDVAACSAVVRAHAGCGAQVSNRKQIIINATLCCSFCNF